jgi:DNA-binding NtrC family response regulator
VRELENTLHRSVLMAQGNAIDAEAILLKNVTANPVVTASGTPAEAPRTAAAETATDTPLKKSELVGRTVGDVEREMILDTLDHCLGNRTQAAQILGISIRTLRNKLKQYNEEIEAKTGTGGY